MRKALALFTAILIAMLGIYTAIFVQINNEKDNVVVTENVVFGDKSYADGITVSADSKHGNRLLWETDYTIGEAPVTKTDFTYHHFGFRYEDTEIRRNMSIYTSFHFSTSAGDYNEIYKNTKKAFEEMMKDAEPYVQQEKTILLSDYYDYYPLVVDIDFPNFYISDYFFRDDITEYKLSVINKLNEFFRIPVIEGHKLTINGIADEEGNLTQWGTSFTEESADNFDMYIEGSITDENCFLSFSNKTMNGKNVDISNIPGGYGVYCLPYTETENSVNFDFDNMKNIYPVKEETEIYEIRLSYDNKHLYIMTREGEKCILTVIDAKTFKKLQSIEISSFKKGYSYFFETRDNMILYNTYDETNDKNYYTVISIDENKILKNEFTVEALYTGEIAKWDGEFLYLADTEYYDDTYISNPCRFNVTVYNKDGLKYRGSYDLSLSTGYDGNWSSMYYVNLGYDSIDFTLPTK